MKEDFLHFIWKNQFFHKLDLKTTQENSIEVIKTGYHNVDSGPDFFNGKIVLDNTQWIGNIEIHIKSSDWDLHGHQFDKAYNNVILHVVYEHDKEVKTEAGKTIPTLELKSKISDSLILKWKDWKKNHSGISCEKEINEVSTDQFDTYKHRLIIEKLESKSRFIYRDFLNNNENWEQTFYEYLARNFGFKTNALPFYLVAKNTPLALLNKYKDQLHLLEAILLGQSGMLDSNFSDEYLVRLKKEYLYLKKVHQLESIHVSTWKFSKMRPANFPTIRLIQFAELIHRSTNLFSKSIHIENLNDAIQMYDITVHEYWDRYYTLDVKSENKKKNMGKSSIHNILINTIIPFMFLYGQQRDNIELVDKSISLLEQIKSEDNSIVDYWKKLGFISKSAYDSQALVYLKNSYCSYHKCLDCMIGHKILKKATV